MWFVIVCNRRARLIRIGGVVSFEPVFELPIIVTGFPRWPTPFILDRVTGTIIQHAITRTLLDLHGRWQSICVHHYVQDHTALLSLLHCDRRIFWHRIAAVLAGDKPGRL